MCWNACTRMSRTTWKVMRLFTMFISHWQMEVTHTVTPNWMAILPRAGKLTLPWPTIRSTPRPERMGAYSVVRTVTAASSRVNSTKPRYGWISFNTR